MKTISMAIVMVALFGLLACSGNNDVVVPSQNSVTTDMKVASKSAGNFFVRFTPPNTFAPNSNGVVEMSLNGNYAATDPHSNHSWWTDYYTYFQTVRNTNTFEMKDWWDIPYLPSQTWGVFRIAQSGGTYTLYRIEGSNYVTVITANSFADIVDRLQFIYINGTPQHKEAISKMNILSYRIN